MSEQLDDLEGIRLGCILHVDTLVDETIKPFTTETWNKVLSAKSVRSSFQERTMHPLNR